MAGALETLLSDGDRRRRLASLGMARSQMFSISASAEAHLDVYRALAARAESIPAMA
jgi:glycosyltransferase involved in cell wall biosynthesis